MSEARTSMSQNVYLILKSSKALTDAPPQYSIHILQEQRCLIGSEAKLMGIGERINKNSNRGM